MKPGPFVWYDLGTTDPAAATRFYESVVGWTAEPVPGMDYTLLKHDEHRTAGVMELPPHLRQAQVPPHWSGYVWVDDVDAGVTKVEAAGGSVKLGAQDIPGVGRFAVVADPQGAVFYLFNGAGEPPAGPAMMRPGSIGWHELHTSDPEAAFGFYASQFGWTRGTAMDIGPMGTYQMFGFGEGDRGGMMNTQGGERPHWLFYFVVDGLDAAMGRVQAQGGTVVHGPQEVPGGAWVLIGRDPQGAFFALVSATK